ncbi:MAG TPA: toxin-antitoxin system HicB family antitoxin [Actinophytocola sp.]|jgi:plasmid stability protein|uniref:FitA-like ribbon-helix-helix domain-containing protein n=1 Tax=Actinophytocola sp. TaxID=1872138 RepID=UPI002E084D58|nr:toxin-antitoxin system HicB family antitoxin [Actinophytocola sp.]
MITRLDDELHARLKEQAAVEGRSVNEFVIAALTLVLDGSTARRSVRERARATGRLVLPDPPAETPSWRDVELVSREFGTAVSEALEAERSAR